MATSAILFFALVAGYQSQYCDAHPQAKGKVIRAVDFCNFEYPGVKLPYDDPGEERIPGHFKLSRGVRLPDSEDGEGLILLEDVHYGDVTRDRQEEAVITLTWFSGGTMHLGMVYVWGLSDGKPALLWTFVGGDRGFGGLRRAYADSGDLLLEVYDSDAAVGNCCSRRIIRTRYRWNGAKFVPQVKPEKLPNPDYQESPDDDEQTTP